jgi:hypothetical protein
MGVVAGLTMSSVDRLKFSKLSVSESLLNVLDELVKCMTPDGSWKVYRDTLRNCAPPAIPYLGTYLTDITFIEEGNPSNITYENIELINFKKRELLSKVFQEVHVYQSQAYSIEPKEPLLSFLRFLPHCVDENVLYAMSLQREPRGCTIKDLVT